ncbi:hypothetical protein N0V88_004006 [Collariella sp. IMI 366227]|nr:hypothetical protein N0V88_004006 [Collariella sp. IMI 366227]
MAAEGSEPKSYSTDPALYIYTSLTAGSSHIVTATSRLETILRANRVPFKAIDIATDEKARMLWGRRAGKDAGGRVRKLPGLVQMGLVLGDLVEIEEWNEYGELKQHVTFYYDEFTQPQLPLLLPPAHPHLPQHRRCQPRAEVCPRKVTATASTTAAKVTLPVRSIAEEAAAKAKQIRLQNLREQVHGKGASSSSSTSKDTTSSPSPKPTTTTSEPKPSSPASAAGLQSPTSSGWKGPSGPPASTMQSPTSGSWKPTDVDPPVTELHGSVVASASKEEIAAVERAETIKEEEGEEEESSEEEESDDSEEEEESEEEVKKEK